MPNELMTTQVVKEVASALGTMLAAYREHRMVRMEHKILLQQKIKAFRSMNHSRAIGEIFRANIEEIEKAQKLINSMNFSNHTYKLAMEQLRVLHEELMRNLREFSNGY